MGLYCECHLSHPLLLDAGKRCARKLTKRTDDDNRYILLQPLLRVFTKSPSSAVQSVLHALFLPTAFKTVPSDATDEDRGDKSTPGEGGKGIPGKGEKGKENEKAGAKRAEGNKLRFREVLKPGALYGECAVVSLDVPSPPAASTSTSQPATSTTKEKGKAKGAKEGQGGGAQEEETIEMEDDGEYGGEEVGRRVWEAYEGALKVWEGKTGGKSDGGERDGKAKGNGKKGKR